MLSVSNWRKSWPRLAPIAKRTAISLCRTAARANNKLATFAQAIRRSKPNPRLWDRNETVAARNSRSSARPVKNLVDRPQERATGLEAARSRAFENSCQKQKQQPPVGRCLEAVAGVGIPLPQQGATSLPDQWVADPKK